MSHELSSAEQAWVDAQVAAAPELPADTVETVTRVLDSARRSSLETGRTSQRSPDRAA